MNVMARIGVALLGLAAVIAFCVKYAGPTPQPQLGPVWVVNHVAMNAAPTNPTTTYTAYCVPVDKLDPDTPPAAGDLVQVPITENQFLWLQPGNACPGR
jgi:hypothetical protein